MPAFYAVVLFRIKFYKMSVYNDANSMDNDEIKAGFRELYQTMNGMPLREMDTIVNPVCALCRDYEQAEFVHGVQVGMLLAKELA